MKKTIFTLFLTFYILTTSYAQSLLTLELKDAPVRAALELIFKQANVNNYVIDPSVEGFVNMKITDQSLENTLKLLMRASSKPLTYNKENNIYIVKIKEIQPENNFKQSIKVENFEINNIVFEKIPLNYIDPLDLQILFGPILNIRQFSRMNRGLGNDAFGMGGGFGLGGNNNFNSNNLGNNNSGNKGSSPMNNLNGRNNRR